VHEETLTGRPHDASVQKATSDNENEDAVERRALDITRCGCSLTSCPEQCLEYRAIARGALKYSTWNIVV